MTQKKFQTPYPKEIYWRRIRPDQPALAIGVVEFALQKENPPVSNAEGAEKITYSPETLSEHDSIKSIDSYFASIKKPIFHPATTNPSTSHEIVRHFSKHDHDHETGAYTAAFANFSRHALQDLKRVGNVCPLV